MLSERLTYLINLSLRFSLLNGNTCNKLLIKGRFLFLFMILETHGQPYYFGRWQQSPSVVQSITWQEESKRKDPLVSQEAERMAGRDSGFCSHLAYVSHLLRAWPPWHQSILWGPSPGYHSRIKFSYSWCHQLMALGFKDHHIFGRLVPNCVSKERAFIYLWNSNRESRVQHEPVFPKE